MTEDEAHAWVAARWPVEMLDRLAAYESLVRAESSQQNLVASSTLDHFWARHIVDSAQLVTIADTRAAAGTWVDVGSGAGLPGVVAAILQPRPVILVEPRRRRAEFLQTVVDRLGLRATVAHARIETMQIAGCAVVSARAVAALDPLFDLAVHLADRNTLWLVPKGRSAQSEMAAAGVRWHGLFHVEQSVTATDSLIVIAQGIKLR